VATVAEDTTASGHRALALSVLCTVLFLTFLDNTVVSVALGSVQTDLHAGVSALQWVVGAYALTFAALMLAFGMLGDQIGRRRVMVAGVVVFCAGSVLSALAGSSGMLIAGRAVMGVGAAASEPGTLSMLRHIFPDDRARTRAIGVWAAVSGLALAAGPLIGGVLVGAWDWHAIFWFNLVFGLLVLAVIGRVLPESADPGRGVDVVGATIGALGLAALVFAVMTGESDGFGTVPVIVLFVATALAAAGFVWWERHAEHPLVPLRLLRVPRFSTANVVAFAGYFATFAVFFFTALYLDEIAGYSGYDIARVFAPMALAMIVTAVLAGRWTTRTGVRWSTTAGCVVFGGGLLLVNVTLSPHPGYAALAGALTVTGFGIGATVVPITASVLSAVPARQSGMAASAANTSREIGAVTGVAVLGALVNAQLRHDLTGRLNGLGVPASFQNLVITALETGAVPSSSAGTPTTGAAAGQGKLVQEVIGAAYHAFGTGLHAALYVSAALVFAAAILAAITLGRPGADAAT
jgi:EmrB/QacA subfamily drug resistance transporter